MDGKSLDEVEAEMQKQRENLSKEMDALVKTFIQDNYNNVLGPGIFIMLCNGFPYPLVTPLIEEIVDDAPESFKNNRMVKTYMDAARENMKKLGADL